MSSLDFEVDDVDEILPPARPAPEQHLEVPRQRLDRMLRWHADLLRQLARSTDAAYRERLQRLIRHREVGIEYQRGVLCGFDRERLRRFVGGLGQ